MLGLDFGSDAIVIATYPFVLFAAGVVSWSFWWWWRSTRATMVMRSLIFGVWLLNLCIVIEKMFGIATRLGWVDPRAFEIFWIIAPVNLLFAFASYLHYRAYLRVRFAKLMSGGRWLAAGVATCGLYPVMVALLW